MNLFHHQPTPTEARIIMLLSDLLTINQSVVGQLNNAETKILAAMAALNATIVDLTTQLADAPLSQVQADAVNAVVAAAQNLDNIVPDPAEPVPPTA